MTSPVETVDDLSHADRVEILELHSRYNRAVDHGDSESWAACFAPDGIFDARSRYAEGTAALETFARDYHGQEAYRGAVHWNNNIVVEGAGDEVTAHTDYMLVRGTAEGIRILSTGSYLSRVIRQDGRWVFASRKSTVTAADPELLALFER
jgi:hypothetical protein